MGMCVRQGAGSKGRQGVMTEPGRTAGSCGPALPGAGCCRSHLPPGCILRVFVTEVPQTPAFSFHV